MIRKLMRSWTALTLLVVFAGACGEVESPVAPDAPEVRASAANSGPAVKYLARYRSGPPSITIGLAARTIGPEGGSIELLGFEVVVPAGAVDRPTHFTIRLPVDSPTTSEYVMAEFGPHGIQFAVPVTLRLPWQGTTAEGTGRVPSVLWWNGAAWERMPTSETRDGRVEAPTTHFSTYGTEATSADGGYIIAGG